MYSTHSINEKYLKVSTLKYDLTTITIQLIALGKIGLIILELNAISSNSETWKFALNKIKNESSINYKMK
ncbi:hypothetical protein SAMN04487992_105295 [Cellulophaga baltica]|uniref:Uncharacterized protein n=1 Tax=Cellulophaga baltica TaxID=76594 RepID=A0A1G7H656_9FLAO|nr:hypothetical protein SAMN04487992_105295 [Cellulophaga baltica]